MAPPVLLTVPTSLDVRVGVDGHPRHATNTNDTQRHVTRPLDFGLLVDAPHPSPGPSAPSAPSFSLSSTGTHPPTSNAGTTHADAHAVVKRQWTGAPMRAIVPLPRRMRASPHGQVAHRHVPASAWRHGHGRPIRDDADTDADADTDSDAEIRRASVASKEDEQDGDGDEDEDGAERRRTRSRYYSYESITAAGGLSAWSFEELRIECYAQSLVARGTKPSPVVQPSLAIPPAFVPRVISRR